jgi:sialic acid synthase SpsE/RimJ/RimL family protein N-acetyltransferase
MSDATFTLESVRPVEEHARLILAWRNDPLTRQMSFNQDEQSWEQFWPSFPELSFRNPNLPPLFVVKDGQRVAFLAFRAMAHPVNPRLSACDISINVAPEARGQGIATEALRLALDFLKKQGLDEVWAEIKVENQASFQAFQKAGFSVVKEIDKHHAPSGQTYRIQRFKAVLVPSFMPDGSVYVIAEAGSNWRMGTPKRDREMARALIDVAVLAGANAVKFQTYRPESVYVENAGSSDYLSENGISESIRDIFTDLAMPYDLIGELAEYSRQQGIDFMSTPFSRADFEAVDPYVAIHKIASYEISHVRLLELAARSGKPLILSTGASTEADIAWAVNTFYANGGTRLCLLQCTAKYPAPLDSLNLNTIPWLKRRFGVPAGLSDHSRDPVFGPLAAVALGAQVIEKHYTLDNRLPGPDHPFALTPDELTRMVQAIRAAEQVTGTGIKEILPAEAELSTYARRGVQAIRPIAKGERLLEDENIAILRPGKQRLGLHPRFMDALNGRPAQRDIPLGDGIFAEDWVAGSHQPGGVR